MRNLICLLAIVGILAAAGASAADPIWLVPGVEVSGTLGNDTYYAFNATDAQIYNVTLVPSETDIDVRVLGPLLQEIDVSNRGGTDAEMVLFKADRNGTYYAMVYGQNGGDYAIKLVEGGPEPCSIHASCTACSSQSGCGWCADSGTCTPGTSLGASSSACAHDYWVWVPNGCASVSPMPSVNASITPSPTTSPVESPLPSQTPSETATQTPEQTPSIASSLQPSPTPTPSGEMPLMLYGGIALLVIGVALIAYIVLTFKKRLA